MTTLKVTPTDTIKVEYVLLPLVSTDLRIMYRVLEPVEQCVRFFEVSYLSVLNGSGDPVDLLKQQLLSEWRDAEHMREFIAEEIDKVIDGRSQAAHWMTKIDKVEAIECDLIFKPKA